jgi:hypothetical protein
VSRKRNLSWSHVRLSPVPSMTTDQKSQCMLDLAAAVDAHVTVWGFVRGGRFQFVNRLSKVSCDETFQRLVLDRNLPRDGRVKVYANVHVVFPAALKLANRLRSTIEMPMGIGGSIGRFGPPKGHIEWTLTDVADVPVVAAECLTAVDDWAVPFWRGYESIEMADSRFQKHDFLGVVGWEDVVAVHYVVGGLEHAVNQAMQLPDKLLLPHTRRVVTRQAIAEKLRTL